MGTVITSTRLLRVNTHCSLLAYSIQLYIYSHRNFLLFTYGEKTLLTWRYLNFRLFNRTRSDYDFFCFSVFSDAHNFDDVISCQTEIYRLQNHVCQLEAEVKQQRQRNKVRESEECRF